MVTTGRRQSVCATVIWWIEARDDAKHPTMFLDSPAQQRIVVIGLSLRNLGLCEVLELEYRGNEAKVITKEVKETNPNESSPKMYKKKHTDIKL